ncbi:YggS family pyridoxal phosphate enzyme [Exophiala aquamarina CBS 119918]|uniref:Pyridoxal phosphate homeostasis protein n=1 Tax=Exophiala aquamarina CBS 119918 TaxID=1182545 RepID=A0A072PSX7_9EURO|nr:YggS family pyridoxal phosphate enzyme [Exophiala aquamarina CBS 119918]KEF63199.1 YggS family pyridoxal phosphate enzyme [Exophiala aquamarina CBS 119918]
MKIPISPSRASTLAANLLSIQTRIASAVSPTSSKPPRLVAVSKLKPASDILALHQPPTSQQHFGENYVQELLEKARVLPRSVRWHFIGGLQSNKAAQLAREVDNLWAVESVDSVKKAGLLEKGRKDRDERLDKEKGSEQQDSAAVGEPLRVFIQVNTSGEDSKSGLEPQSAELRELARYIQNECPHLRLQGLMTIGAIARSRATTAETENEDFDTLRDTRDWVAKEVGLQVEELELSMGMSEDFEGAIRQGSNEVRVGSTIFGERPPKKDARVLEDTEG